jgi:hypothetical protein
VIERRRFRAADAGEYEVVIVASTLLPLRPGPIPRRYLVLGGSQFVQRYDYLTREGLIGEYNAYSEAWKAAQDFIRDKQEHHG